MCLGTTKICRAVPGTQHLCCQYFPPCLIEFPLGSILGNTFRNSCIKTTPSSSNWIFTKFKLTEWTRPYFKAVLLESMEIIYLKLWSEEYFSEPVAKSHCCDCPYLPIQLPLTATLLKCNSCLMPLCLPTITSDFILESVMFSTVGLPANCFLSQHRPQQVHSCWGVSLWEVTLSHSVPLCPGPVHIPESPEASVSKSPGLSFVLPKTPQFQQFKSFWQQWMTCAEF